MLEGSGRKLMASTRRTPAFWTPVRHERARELYLHFVRMQGNKHGVFKRVADALSAEGLGVTRAAVKLHLTRYHDWSEVDAAAADLIKNGGQKSAETTAPIPAVPDAKPLDPTDERVRRLEVEKIGLTDRVAELRKKLTNDDRRAGIVLELTSVLERSITPLTAIQIPERPAQTDEQPYDVDAVTFMTDQHADRVVRSEATWGLEQYDFNVYRARLFEWAKVIKAYCTRHLPRFRFGTLWVWHLGDAVNGDIHNMKHRNSLSNSIEAALAAGDAQAQALAWLAPHFDRIAVVCVSGNHGRTTPRLEWEDPFDNLDYLVARTMQLRIQGTPLEERVEIITPRAWSAYVDVRGKLWSLNHGMGVKGTWGIPWYGFERREGRVQKLVSNFNKSVDYFAYGHFHTAITRPAGRGKSLHGGAWYMTDGYSLNELNAGNEPEQPLLVCSERFGRQIEIPLMLRDAAREAAMARGEWTPPFGKSIADLTRDIPVGALPIIT